MLKKDWIIFLIICYLALIFRAYILNALFPLKIGQEPLFLTELLGFKLILPSWWVWIADVFNVFAIWQIGKRILKPKTALFSALIYSLSPWIAYSVVGGSVYISLLLTLLSIFLGILFIRENRLIAGVIFISLGIIFSLVISVWSWFIVPALFISSYFITFISYKQLRFWLFFVTVIAIFFVILAFRNIEALSNVTKNQFTIFSDIGLINAVNGFQGELKETGYSKIGKLVENKYTYFSQTVTLSFLKNINPSIYFSPDAQMLKQSFTPPIFIGFFIPFIYGLRNLKVLWKRYKYSLIVLFFLAWPSILSLDSPNITKLILISPIFFYLISEGLIGELLSAKDKITKLIMITTISLIIFQFIVFIFDLQTREFQRLFFLRFPI